MNPHPDKPESREKNPRLIRFENLRRQRSTRDLPLVKFAAWAVIIAAILAVILVVWGLAKSQHALVPFGGVDTAD